MVSKTMMAMRIAAVVGFGMTVSACGGGSGSDATATTPPVIAATPQEDKFGTVFGMDYRASANSEPATTNESDLVAVSLTTEPINVN